MKKTPIVVMIFLVVAIGLIYAAKKAIPIIRNRVQLQTSDAKGLKGKMTLAVDDWIGYYPLSSSRMKKYMRSEGYLLDVANDGADYPARMKKLQSGELNFAVVTVDSYILNAAPLDFPGVIILVIDESKGGDAMVANTNIVRNLDTFNERGMTTSQGGAKIAYTASSPSEHLLKTISSHFNVPGLKNLNKDLRVKTASSDEAFNLFKEGKVPVAILWEPNVSKALKLPYTGKIIGTESMSGVIVDILVVNRDFAAKNPEQVDLLLKTYFRVLKFYADNPEDEKKDIATDQKLPAESIREMLSGVAMVNLSRNCQEWFGIAGPGQIAEQGLVDTIGSTVSILMENGDFKDSPLPDKDPYRIINSTFVSQIYENAVKTGFASLDGAAGAAAGTGLDRPFKALSDAQWAALSSVGKIKIEPVAFQSGLASLDVSEKEKLDAMVNRLKHYPTFRIVVGGHTSTDGDASANQELSQERADAVARYLSVTYTIDQNRIRSVGYGGSKPLPKLPDESSRAYGYRLPRVEISLLAESY